MTTKVDREISEELLTAYPASSIADFLEIRHTKGLKILGVNSQFTSFVSDSANSDLDSGCLDNQECGANTENSQGKFDEEDRVPIIEMLKTCKVEDETDSKSFGVKLKNSTMKLGWAVSDFVDGFSTRKMTPEVLHKLTRM